MVGFCPLLTREGKLGGLSQFYPGYSQLMGGM